MSHQNTMHLISVNGGEESAEISPATVDSSATGEQLACHNSASESITPHLHRTPGGQSNAATNRLPHGTATTGDVGNDGFVRKSTRCTLASPVEFVQINLHKSSVPTAILQKTLSSLKKLSISLIQEPWVHGSTIRGLNSPDWKVFYSKEQRLPPRAAITCSNELTPQFLPQLSSKDLCVVKITANVTGNGKQDLIIASAYLPYDELIATQKLEAILDYCQVRRLECLIGMDANSHHTLWGSSDTNRRGSELLEFLCSKNLYVLNEGNEPTFVNKLRQEVIDITVASQGMANLVENWYVSHEASMSDHRQIRLQIRCGKFPKKFFRNVKKTNWETYVNRLTLYPPDVKQCLNSPEEIDDAAKAVERAIMLAYTYACPSKPTGKRRQPLWWSDENRAELVERRREARSTHKTALLSKAEEDWEVHKVAKRAFKKAIQKAKRSSWRKFCKSVESAPEMSRMSKILKYSTSSQLGMLKLPTGDFTNSNEQALQHMFDTHFPGCTVDGTVQYVRRQPTVADWRIVNRTISRDKIAWAISEMEPYKSPGVDGIYPILLQKGIDVLMPYLIRLYRSSMAYAHVPLNWQSVRVCFIPKVGKDEYVTAKAFRPISLSSFLLKGLEKLVDRRLKDVYMLTHPLHKHQHAYRAGRSTETALHEFVMKVDKTLHDKQYALACFIDIEGAFNFARFCDIRAALTKRGVSPVVVDWCTAMLTQRVVHGKLGDSTCKAVVHQGTAQGGVLSALFWVLVIDELLVRLNREYFTLGYSDDTTIVLKGLDPGTLCGRMNNALRIVEQWCQERGMSVNAAKTELMLFTKNRSKTVLRPVKLNGITLEYATQVKYLGVILDPKLAWNLHIEQKCKKATRAFWQSRSAIGKTWGLTPKVAHWLYKITLLTSICYGSIVWWQATSKVFIARKLTKVQRLACLSITGAMRTAPTVALELIVGFRPITVHIQATAAATAFRLQNVGMRPRNVDQIGYGHAQIWKYLDGILEMKGESDYILPQYHFSSKYTTSIPSREMWKTGRIEQPENTMICFTDGSRCEAENSCTLYTGAGIYCEMASLEECIFLGANATVFQAEVFAIYKCAELLTLTANPVNVIINTDSQAAIGALRNPKITSKVVLDCVKTLNELANDRKVHIRYVTAHSNITGNEIADFCAKSGAKRRENHTTANVGLAPCVGQSMIKTWALGEHSKLWLAEPKCRQSHENIGEIPRKTKVKWFLALKRNHAHLLTSILTGHCRLMRHLTLLGIKQSAECPLCGWEEESASHFICICPEYSPIRNRIFGQPVIDPKSIPNIPWPKLLQFILQTERFEMDYT